MLAASARIRRSTIPGITCRYSPASPGALRNGAPFKNWMLPASLEKERRKLAGSADGDRQMVSILTGVLTDGLPASRPVSWVRIIPMILCPAAAQRARICIRSRCLICAAAARTTLWFKKNYDGKPYRGLPLACAELLQILWASRWTKKWMSPCRIHDLTVRTLSMMRAT